MSSINSRNKGKVGEREWAGVLTEAGFPAARGVQFQGGKDSPDVKCEALAAFHFEVKRVENLNLGAAMEQAVRDAGSGKIPCVAHRRNGKPWLVTLPANDFLALLQKLLNVQAPEPVKPDEMVSAPLETPIEMLVLAGA